jgi:hypothetical protein
LFQRIGQAVVALLLFLQLSILLLERGDVRFIDINKLVGVERDRDMALFAVLLLTKENPGNCLVTCV